MWANLHDYGLGVFVVALLFGGYFWILRMFAKSFIEQTLRTEFQKGIELYKTEMSVQVELVKAALNKSQSIFSKQLESLATLRRMHRKILPKKDHPEMDWDEACTRIAHYFSRHADTLDEFLCNFSSVLPKDIIAKIETAIVVATPSIIYDALDSGEYEQSSQGISDANRFYELISNAVEALQKVVDQQLAVTTGIPVVSTEPGH